MIAEDREAQEQLEAVAMWVVQCERSGDSYPPGFQGWLELPTERRAIHEAFWEMWKLLDGLDPERKIDVSALIARAKEGQPEPPPREAADEVTPTERSPVGTSWQLAGAVTVAAAVVVAWAGLLTPGTHTYETGFGEQRSLKLTDGSVVHLNINSKLEVRYSDKERYVSLLSGEAQFVVEQVASRPFRVQVGPAVVQVLGTRFDIYRQALSQEAIRTTISVIAGEVSVLLPDRNGTKANVDHRQYAPPPGVDTQKLVAGEQLSFDSDGGFEKVENPDLANVALWPLRRLAFNQTPLLEVAREFNRYNTIQIEVEGEALRSRRINGRYSVDHPDSLIAALQSDDSKITVTRQADRVILRSN